MKFSKKQKMCFYLILFTPIAIILHYLYKNFPKFNDLDPKLKETIIIYILSTLLFTFIITFFYSFVFNEIIRAYLDFPNAKRNFIENFPYIYKFLFNKFTKKCLKIFSIYVIWNYSLYIESISESMIIAFVLFIPSILIKKDFQVPKKDIIKTLFLAIFIYIISLFLTDEPKIKISFYKIYLNDNRPFETILSTIRAIFHFEFYLSFFKIIHIVINYLSKEKIMKKD